MSAERNMQNTEGGGRERAADVLVCFALPEEARPFRRWAGAHPGIGILVTGIGQKNSERSFRAKLVAAARTPELVLTCGFAGALHPDLTLGEVVFSADAESGLTPRLLAAGAREIRFHCADRIAATAVAKQSLRQSTGADAVEMESEIIRRLCRERGIPSATMRVISDTAQEDLPLDFNLLLTADQSMDYAKLAVAILKSPGKITALLWLQKQTRFAAERLAGVLAGVVAGGSR